MNVHFKKVMDHHESSRFIASMEQKPFALFIYLIHLLDHQLRANLKQSHCFILFLHALAVSRRPLQFMK